MNEPSSFYNNTDTASEGQVNTIPVPVEIVSEEEMAFIEAALASTRPLLSSTSSFSSSSSSLSSSPARLALVSALPSVLSPLRRPTGSLHSAACSHPLPAPPDIEGSAGSARPKSLLHQFRSRRGLTVTDITATVVEKVEVPIKSVEDSWAVRFMNFIVGANQLMFEGLTRELPVLQLMCYKYLWDNLVADSFPTDHFFNHFNLNPLYILSGDVKEYIVSLGFNAKTLEDVFTYFRDTCCLLSPSQGQLLLRSKSASSSGWESEMLIMSHRLRDGNVSSVHSLPSVL
ncbi:exonuclease V, chloroplastic [Cocos nucifera]|uniref:Exonuclease V, chloroplastic n=1 Tax=Cocos nucifera TaxID=13894 RepID=A0A8K0IYQ9_COCNU|nr:exonuclease V, chloroplastic [Cocos nucifera]